LYCIYILLNLLFDMQWNKDFLVWGPAYIQSQFYI
jgi:hypothetical protein